jgi:hypothetical protein
MKDSLGLTAEEIKSLLGIIEEWLLAPTSSVSGKVTRTSHPEHGERLGIHLVVERDLRSITPSEMKKLSESNNSWIVDSWSLPKVEGLEFVTRADQTAAKLDAKGITNEIADIHDSRSWKSDPVAATVIDDCPSSHRGLPAHGVHGLEETELEPGRGEFHGTNPGDEPHG